MPPEGYNERENKRREEIFNSFLSDHAREAREQIEKAQAALIQMKIYRKAKWAHDHTHWQEN